MRQIRTMVAAALVLILAWGCDSNSATVPHEAPPRLTSHIAAGAKVPLDANGRLRLAAAPAGRHPRIDEVTALQLATRAVTQIGPFILPALEIQRGGSINLSELVADPRPLFASSPYAELPSEAHRGLRNLYGPYFLVYFRTAAGEPVLSVAVAAHTDAKIVNGRIVTGPQDGNDFMIEGLPQDKGEYVPILPERAVEIATTAAGRKVVATPEFIGPGRMFVPQLGRWKVTLDRAVSIRGRATGQEATVRELFVGLWGEIEYPTPGQPATVQVASVGRVPEIALARLAHSPVEFEQIDILSKH